MSAAEFPQEWRTKLNRKFRATFHVGLPWAGHEPVRSAADCHACQAAIDTAVAALAEVAALRDPDAETFEEWRVTGDPGDHYPPYDFTWPPFRDPHRDSDPGPAARAFVAMVQAHDKPWRDGPHLSRRTVTVTEWEALSD